MTGGNIGSGAGPTTSAVPPLSVSAAPNLIVGIGASNGGAEAFAEMLRHLPPTTGAAIVLVQRTDSASQDLAPNALAGHTAMPVIEALHGTALEPNHVYIVPPRCLATVERAAINGATTIDKASVQTVTLKIEPPPPVPLPFRPVDTFFQSLADNFQSCAVGILLSGTVADGTLGLKAIKAAGGITFAQNQTAKFDAMPRAAISAGAADFVLSPRRMAEKLIAISERDAATTGRVADAASLKSVLALLQRKTGVDFRQYKQPTILRRMHRRIVLRNADNAEQYLGMLEKEPSELKALFDDLLITVTAFFRDPGVFESLRRHVFPALAVPGEATIRFWVPGCSSGEEVYSLAIELFDVLEREGHARAIQIFGTDISEDAITRARSGIYDSSSLANVAPERLKRFFVKTPAGYQVSRNIRELCVFSRHNVASDPPLSRMHLISCRNLLIYLSPALQNRVLCMFGYALQPSGCLVLGPSESLRGFADCFETIDEGTRIYRKKAEVPQTAFRIEDSIWDSAPEYFAPLKTAPARPGVRPPDAQAGFSRPASEAVRAPSTPASLVVDEGLHILEYRGDVKRFLTNVEEQPGADLMDAVADELRAPLAAAIDQARRTSFAVVAEDIPNSDGIGHNDTGHKPGAALETITVVPFSAGGTPPAEASPGTAVPHFLILFQELKKEAAAAAPAPPEREATQVESPGDENARLRLESKANREYLQSVIEELRSTNEEAQAANEELQSTNEEMQTSKEELQSSNEELNTINAEMQSRNAELARLNDDLINLLGSMNMPIVMTGQDLRIRRFTPSAERVLSLIATDIGRPIADLKPRINVSNLEEIFQSVLETLQPWEQEVRDREGRFYLMHVRPYRTSDSRIDGAVLQLLDVSELKRTMAEVQHARDYAEAIVNTVREPLVVLDRNLAIQNGNPAFFDTLHLTRSSAIGRSILNVAGGRLDLPQLRGVLARGTLEQGVGGPGSSDIEIEYRVDPWQSVDPWQVVDPRQSNGAAEGKAETGENEVRILLLNARRLSTPDRRQLILLSFRDVTERKRAAEARYRRLFESARDGIVLVDAVTGEILDVNPFTEQLLGYTRDELANRKIWEIEPMRTMPKVRAAIERIREQGYFRIDDLPLRTKDGRMLQTEMIASVYSEGERRAIQFNIRDVSERKKFERELQETQKLESLGLLAGGIAHDFNNLLTGILGNASLAYSELPENLNTRRQLREIIQASERAAFLTRQMLAYAGRGRVSSEMIDLGSLILDISALVRSSMPKTVELRLDLPADLPPIEADPAQIQQVVMNLIINAAEAIGDAQPGKVEIRTSLRELDAGQHAEVFGPGQPGQGTYVQMEVTDNGSGMDEATRSRIFDPFFTTKFAGRGLGLAAVQGILRSHSGAIRVYSTPGHGSSFLILLPAKHRKAAVRGPKPAAEPHIAPGRVILVVDDEEMVRTVASTALSSRGLKVLLAQNGKIAVELFRQHNAIIAAVLLDLQMPVMGGEEAFRQMVQINPDVPVILSSGYDESETAGRFSGDKPARFLQKPYTTERLLEAVAAAAATRPN